MFFTVRQYSHQFNGRIFLHAEYLVPHFIAYHILHSLFIYVIVPIGMMSFLIQREFCLHIRNFIQIFVEFGSKSKLMGKFLLPTFHNWRYWFLEPNIEFKSRKNYLSRTLQSLLLWFECKIHIRNLQSNHLSLSSFVSRSLLWYFHFRLSVFEFFCFPSELLL